MGGAVRGDEFEGVEADGAVVEGVLGGLFGLVDVAGRGDRGALPCGAAQERFDADEEDVEIEGLGQVVVGTGFDAFEDVLGAGAGGEHENGCVTPGFAEGPDNREAVGPGGHGVEGGGGYGVFGGEEVGGGGVGGRVAVGAGALG